MAKAKELREMAKERLCDALSGAYYVFTDGGNEEYNSLSEKDKEAVLTYLDQYGTAMCKSIKKNYYTT